MAERAGNPQAWMTSWSRASRRRPRMAEGKFRQSPQGPMAREWMLKPSPRVRVNCSMARAVWKSGLAAWTWSSRIIRAAFLPLREPRRQPLHFRGGIASMFGSKENSHVCSHGLFLAEGGYV